MAGTPEVWRIFIQQKTHQAKFSHKLDWNFIDGVSGLDMGVTDFFKRHTRHTTPLFVAGIVFVGVPTLTTLDTGMENLAKLGNVTSYDWNRVLVKAAIVGLSALGGFMSTTYHEWKDDKKQRDTAPPVPEPYPR